LLKSATTNTPRIEYDADGNRLGLLIEEARTNLITQSEALNTGWSIGSATVAADQAVAPDGNTTADEVNLSSGGFIYRTPTVTASTTYTASWYIKAGTATAWVYGFFDGTAGSFINRVQYDITDGEDVGNGWYRFNVSVTTPAGCTSLRVYPIRTSTGGGEVAGVVGTSFVWGAQLEAGSFPTSYIPTAGATATRAADVASIPTSAFGYNQKAGTVVVEASTYRTPDSDTYLWQIDSGAGDDRYTARLSSVVLYAAFVIIDTVTAANLSAGSALGAGDTIKFGYAFADGDQYTYSAGFSDTGTAGLPANRTTLRLGSDVGTSRQLNGHIKSIQYFPRRLTNAQLQELTA
jgi:hypothetical protein